MIFLGNEKSGIEKLLDGVIDEVLEHAQIDGLPGHAGGDPPNIRVFVPANKQAELAKAIKGLVADYILKGE